MEAALEAAVTGSRLVREPEEIRLALLAAR